MKQRIIFIFIILLLLPPVFAEALSPTKAQEKGAQDPISANLEKLEDMYRFIDEEFLYELDHDAIYEGLAKALLSSLGDPYSEYITAEESQKLEDQTKGIYGGIGAYISKPNPSNIDKKVKESYMVMIVSPFPGSPAAKAGLHAGDLISEIDGEPVDELNVSESAAKLRGEADTVVKLLVHRGESTFRVEITRAIVEIPTVRHDMIGTVGYLQILEFTPLTAEKVEEAVQDFTQNGYTSIVMDLRSNPGGIVDSAVKIADLFLSDKTVLIMESRREHAQSSYRTRSGTTIPEEIPLIILTNGGTASASEILAGALRDHGRAAVIIGSTSFGKGVVQSIYPYYDGDYFKFTSAQYLTPNGSNIHEVGIAPDIEVEEPELSDEELQSYEKLMEERLINTYAASHEGFRDHEVNEFVKELQAQGYGLTDRLLRKLIRSEFESFMDYPPIYDLEYDIVLQRGLEFVTKGELGNDY